MFWTGFSFDNRTRLFPLFGDSEARRGGMTARRIYELYSYILPRFLQPRDASMHDNSPLHTPRLVRGYLEDLEIEVIAKSDFSNATVL